MTQLVQKIIDYNLGADMVKTQWKMLDTNNIEAIHNCVFHLCTQCKMQKRTLKARDYNSALIDSVQ